MTLENVTHLFAGRLLRNELPLIMKKSSKSVSSVELLAVRDLFETEEAEAEDSTKAALEAFLGDVDTNWAAAPAKAES